MISTDLVTIHSRRAEKLKNVLKILKECNNQEVEKLTKERNVYLAKKI